MDMMAELTRNIESIKAARARLETATPAPGTTTVQPAQDKIAQGSLGFDQASASETFLSEADAVSTANILTNAKSDVPDGPHAHLSQEAAKAAEYYQKRAAAAKEALGQARFKFRQGLIGAEALQAEVNYYDKSHGSFTDGLSPTERAAHLLYKAKLGIAEAATFEAKKAANQLSMVSASVPLTGNTDASIRSEAARLKPVAAKLAIEAVRAWSEAGDKAGSPAEKASCEQGLEDARAYVFINAK